MFAESIQYVGNFTRPLHTILRTYGGKNIVPGAATLFFVNELGYAITCKHVVDILNSSNQWNKNYNEFRNEKNNLLHDTKYNEKVRQLEMKYKISNGSVIQIKNTFMDCVDSMKDFTQTLHPKFDLAIIKFNGFNNLMYKDFAKFKKTTSQIQPGEFLCRLGFPFPEFNNFKFNETADEIEWTNEGAKGSPRFPIEGMITRFLVEQNKLFGIELSTPGLKGQSGGPLFNKSGIVYGMQSSTKHLHLGFDIEEKELWIDNKLKKVSNYSFIHLGQCIHAEVIKEFLAENNVKYYEED